MAAIDALQLGQTAPTVTDRRLTGHWFWGGHYFDEAFFITRECS